MVRFALSYSSGVSSVFNSSPSACQPASLKRPVTGSGKIDRATGPKPAKRASVCRSSGVARRFSCSMRLSVRMAARMSRALAFSPLAIGTVREGPACSSVATSESEWSKSAGGPVINVGVDGGSMRSVGSDSAASSSGGASNGSSGWPRAAVTRAACEVE